MVEGGAVRYRSVGRVVYHGKFVRMIDAHRALIEVDAGAKDPVSLTVEWREQDGGEQGTAWPVIGQKSSQECI